MPKLAIMAPWVATMLMCSACGGEPDDRSVLFSQCEKEKQYSTEVCQCLVDARMEHYDKDVLRVFVLRAQGRHGEADTLERSIPVERSTTQTVKYAFAATECKKGGAS